MAWNMEHMHVDEGPADDLDPQGRQGTSAQHDLIGTRGTQGIGRALDAIPPESDSGSTWSPDYWVLKPEDHLASPGKISSALEWIKTASGLACTERAAGKYASDRLKKVPDHIIAQLLQHSLRVRPHAPAPRRPVAHPPPHHQVRVEHASHRLGRQVGNLALLQRPERRHQAPDTISIRAITTATSKQLAGRDLHRGLFTRAIPVPHDDFMAEALWQPRLY